MIVLVLPAFVAAGLADFGTHAADVVGELRTAAHKAGRRPAHDRTVVIEMNAAGNVRDVRFAEAGRLAVLASAGTADARLDAGVEFVMVVGAFVC